MMQKARHRSGALFLLRASFGLTCIVCCHSRNRPAPWERLLFLLMGTLSRQLVSAVCTSGILLQVPFSGSFEDTLTLSPLFPSRQEPPIFSSISPPLHGMERYRSGNSQTSSPFLLISLHSLFCGF